ncbi:sodium-dependent transporter [Halapricum desulfuricans]|uniref:Na+-dependent transporter of the SNF family n=1 Tax=Halapricum desulfuricans TaxID=2841257 RepID=A0A897N5A0_9EURY|nr:sodium-dependent transporter [Halapricum desulfuricans]QSG05526.1 Na+-dependent transporter of the SNF family [Halapricum desulfuricans]
MTNQERAGTAELWSSRTGFILASTGAAVGIGNIWRFPSVVGRNGGGAYLVPYLIAVFVFAVPLMILEIDSGRRARADIVATFRGAGPRFRIFGWFVVAVVVLILSYYLVITGWILAFLGSAIAGTEISLGGFTDSYAPVVSFVASLGIVAAVLSLGVREGIERMTTVLMPLVFVILLGMAAFSATLSGFSAGVAFFLTPDLSVLADPLVWSAAFGQAFFSLSAGMGILITYGGYVSGEMDVPEAATLIAVADVAVAVLAGVVVFPIVFTFGLEPSLGTELAFSTLPAAFALLPGGRVVAGAFFGLLFAAAITSAVSMMEVGVSTVRGATRFSRGQATALVAVSVFVLGLPSLLSYTPVRFQVWGTPFLDLLDDSVGTFGLPVTALVIAITFGHVLDAGEERRSRLERLAITSTKYLLPPVLVVVIVSQLLVGLDFLG